MTVNLFFVHKDTAGAQCPCGACPRVVVDIPEDSLNIQDAIEEAEKHGSMLHFRCDTQRQAEGVCALMGMAHAYWIQVPHCEHVKPTVH